MLGFTFMCRMLFLFAATCVVCAAQLSNLQVTSKTQDTVTVEYSNMAAVKNVVRFRARPSFVSATAPGGTPASGKRNAKTQNRDAVGPISTTVSISFTGSGASAKSAALLQALAANEAVLGPTAVSISSTSVPAVGLATGAVVGITVACAVAAAAIGGGGYYVVSKHLRKNPTQSSSAVEESQSPPPENVKGGVNVFDLDPSRHQSFTGRAPKGMKSMTAAANRESTRGARMDDDVISL